MSRLVSIWDRGQRRARLVVIGMIQRIRILFYRSMSTAKVVNNGAVINQPILFSGKGTITLGRCTLGIFPSPHFLSGYMHLEVREASAQIIIEDGVFINNNCCIIAERSTVRVGGDTLIGPEVSIFDSDFHELDPGNRNSGKHVTKDVNIGRNVFIGYRTTILRGVQIGAHSVIGACSVVSSNVAHYQIASGVPAKAIRSLRSSADE